MQFRGTTPPRGMGPNKRHLAQKPVLPGYKSTFRFPPFSGAERG